MYEQQIASIKKRIIELSEKAQLKKPPKLKISRGAVLASTNALLNELTISEFLLEQWQKGLFDEKDIDAILAHEFGHLISYHQKSHFENFKHSLIFNSYMLLLLAVLLSSAFLPLILPNAMPILFSLLVFFVGIFVLTWCVFLPSILRRAYVPDELEADRNAIAFSLIDAQQLADNIVKKIGSAPPKNFGTFERIDLLENMLKHPQIHENLQNIGFEIKRPIETKRIANQLSS